MCINGLCEVNNKASSVCPFGDNGVAKGSTRASLSTEFARCSDFLKIAFQQGYSIAAFCSSSIGKTQCCLSCKSIFLR